MPVPGRGITLAGYHSIDMADTGSGSMLKSQERSNPWEDHIQQQCH